MMVVDSVVTIAAIAWLFLKLASESERRQELIEEGVDPEGAARAVRYGRGWRLRGRGLEAGFARRRPSGIRVG